MGAESDSSLSKSNLVADGLSHQYSEAFLTEQMDEEMEHQIRTIFDFLAYRIIPEYLKKSKQFFIDCSKYTTVGNKMNKKAAASLLWIPLPSQRRLVL
ncbi:hypothetical protein DSO57_1022262 [Entomophthora muscae]|uniref:Uncharacterized protein n=1 Tax=Entomophthora muscae TaxID=34485 RepID=A0ACC2RHX9_9FUNG|nr:hypothetical protein DSO57_1022262 [Entomophthora muscae]